MSLRELFVSLWHYRRKRHAHTDEEWRPIFERLQQLESISIRPYKDANAPCSLATIFIPDFSILSLLLLSTESGPFPQNVYARTPSSEFRIDTRNRNSSDHI
jgi:hypothetical protein